MANPLSDSELQEFLNTLRPTDYLSDSPQKFGDIVNDFAKKTRAIRQLATTPDPRVVLGLVDVFIDFFRIQDDTEDQREAAGQILGSMREVAIPVLAEVLHDADPHKRLAALELLSFTGQVGDSRITDILLPVLHDKDDEVQNAAFWTLVSVGDQRIVPALIERLPKEHGYAVGQIAGALGRIGDVRAIPVLAELLDHDALWPHKRGLLAALALIGTPEAVEAIRTWKESANGRDTVDQMISMRLEVLQTVPGAELITPAEILEEASPMAEIIAMEHDIEFRLLTLALRIPMLNAQAVAILESLDTPEANQALSDWRYEQGLE